MLEHDIGFSHIALQVRDIESSVDFYQRYAGMQVIHEREPGIAEAQKVAWLSDLTRPFALVLVQSQTTVDTPLGPFGHIGVACKTREEIDAKVALAEQEGVLRRPAQQSSAPVGYWAFFADPDGNTLELSLGQQIGLEIIAHRLSNRD
ncbi:VOC family protein [Candidatus Pantoea floridensis]|uniref:Catechol 2,3-dioxygenase n=1 Tax=Candidatus Pantoea floridensis TaxID=1938870 RepID=A0A286DQB6_9GAMM|nr:VOC family protein [Pantoea floridensis]PIF14924.1 catechol 2,3-dioxygenase-like lactoylglutathione lyase family enzyme [Enterobacteriaceae bacterium JKS000233]SOD60840.1 Catechol 2,3-dioxygenase [Pantoea floridensis]